MNELKIFENGEFGQIRTITIDSEVWFVGKDVAESLGYSNSSKAVSVHVDEDDRIVKTLQAPSQNGNVVKTQTTLINESGLYALIFGSKMESAKKFKRWVTSEVLPTLRQTGSYTLLKPDSYMIEDKVERASRWIEEEEERQQLRQENFVLIEENAEMKPKADFHDIVSASDEEITVNKMAGVLCDQYNFKVGEKKLFEFLRKKKYLCTAQHVWNKPSQAMINGGYMLYKERISRKYNKYKRRREEEIVFTPLITGKGQVYIAKKVMENKEYIQSLIPYKPDWDACRNIKNVGEEY